VVLVLRYFLPPHDKKFLGGQGFLLTRRSLCLPAQGSLLLWFESLPKLKATLWWLSVSPDRKQPQTPQASKLPAGQVFEIILPNLIHKSKKRILKNF